MNKLYTRINWKNYPLENTPINEQNLNRMDAAVNDIDDRVIQQDTVKLSKADAMGDLVDFVIDEETGIVTVTRRNGEKVLFDLNIEKIPVSFYLSEDGILTMITDDGTAFTANIGAMIPALTFEDSDTIAVSVSGEGVTKTYSFTIKNGSVTEEKLQPNYLADIKAEVEKAQSSANSAAQSNENAASNATLSKSWSVGGTGTREGEDTDNAKYYAEQAKTVSKVDIATTETAGIVKPDGITITVDEDGTIHGSTQVDVMTGATSNADGKSGLVPQPMIADKDSFLKGDGTWGVVDLSSKGDSLFYDEENSKLQLKSGNTVLSTVTIEGGVSASQITVTTSSPEYIGKNVSLYLDGSLVETKTFDDTMSVVYKVKLLGTYTVQCEDATATVNVTQFGSAYSATVDSNYATINIGTTSAELFGSQISIKKSNGELVANTVFSQTGTASANVKEIDTYTVACTFDGKEYSNTVDVTALEKTSYSVSLHVSKSTISVTTTSPELYNQTVSLMLNNVEKQSKAFTPDNVAFTVYDVGAYTLVCGEYSENVNVSELDVDYAVSLNTIPDGATVEPINDVPIWLKCAGLNGTGYTTLDQVLADTTTLGSLTMDENAMTYLARSEGFADTLCNNETFMTYLGQSPYVDDTVLNSCNWGAKIKASQYWSLVYTTVYTIHAGALEEITIDGVYGSFTTNSDGNVNHALPLGELTLNGSVSGQSFERTITKDTTEVYVMPENAIYWYGNVRTPILTSGWTFTDKEAVQPCNFGKSKLNTNFIYYARTSGFCSFGFEKIDVTNFNALNVTRSIVVGSSGMYIADTQNSYYTDAPALEWAVEPSEKATDKVDIIKLTGYKFIRFNSGYPGAEANIYAVWLNN